ncbi:parathyroid hormone/parathyroid hormone-related peptide receptor-like [Asbolus verrucosus]|uniref:Parathyroid hormone/parathyroid hormone-related peptide receptor-like n=1 Tax=Asbolus verrucosus TaxID=1661398 RepID=A0A482W0J1_ASBVE|nr:parathyroid hormone/parathyroid hormone-related peptide receptor-like [Asbolus verrucosus]
MNYSSEINEILDKARSNCNNTFYPEIIGGKLCELVFDGFMCWPQTPAGILANQSCSNKYVNGAKKGFATKQCDENGQWLIPDGFTKHWTNYSACGNFTFIKQSLDDKNIYIKWVPIIKNITQFGYILSTIFLITALFVFIHIKRLHCARNKLHGHLFVSFVVRALMSLIKDGLFVKGIALAHDVVYVNGEPQFIKENYSTNENNYCWTQKSSTYIALLIEVPIGLIVICRCSESLIHFLLAYLFTQRKIKLLRFYGYFLIKHSSPFKAFSEVQMEIVRKYNSFKDRNTKEFKRRTRTISHTQQIPLNEEMQEIPQNFGNKEQLLMNKTSDYF